MPEFTHLHCHTQFSLLDGAASISNLYKKAVADALESWPGSIIMVSHDEEFVQRLKPTKVILMPDGQVDYFSKEWLDLVSLS